jgi:hypothetical protein
MKLFTKLTAAAGVAAVLIVTAQLSAQDTVRLQGHVLNILPMAVHLLRTAESAQQPITLTIMLNWSDPAGFHEFQQAFENPASPLFQKHITADELKARFGPSQDAYDAVLAWLQQSGFKLVQGSDSRLTLIVHGTRSQAERAFGVTIDDYLMGHRQFHAIETDPELPAALAPLVRSVSGFTNLARPRPALMNPQQVAQFYNGVLTPDGTLPGTGAGVLPPGIDGTGQTIALIEYDNFVPADVSYWLSQMGLPASLINQVTVVPVDGGVPPSGCSITSDGCGETEVLLDIDAVLGLAPGAKVAVFVSPEDSSDQLTSLFVARNYLESRKGGVISDSWGVCEPEVPSVNLNSMETQLQVMTMLGETFFVASGDHGSSCVGAQVWPNTVTYPADAPHAVAVGGTEINSGKESWWTDGQFGGGFGVSQFQNFTLPSWQANLTNAPLRSVPDVAAFAFSGIPVCQNSMCIGVGGTSLATPIWAAVWALASQAQQLSHGSLESVYAPSGTPLLYSFAASGFLNPPSSMTGPDNDFAHVGLGSPNITSVVSGAAGAPVLSALNPASGPQSGGTTVTLSGQAFIGVSKVLFAGVEASFTVDSESLITAISPSCLPSTACAQSSNAFGAPITVITPAGSVTTPTTAEFAYQASITSVSPSSGPLSGGTSVTVTGAGFETGANSRFRFGTLPAVNAQCSSTTLCTMLTPAQGPGSVEVTYSGSLPANSGRFTYTGPSITSLNPNVGPEIGGIVINLVGTGLASGMTVKFGGASASNVTCTSETQCSAVLPPGNGSVNVEVTVNGVTSVATAEDLFTYKPFPFGKMSPNSGSYLGGTSVTVTGGNFNPAAGATQFNFAFGSSLVPAKSVKCSSTTSCTMVTPAVPQDPDEHSAQSSVSVTANGLTLTIGNFEFIGQAGNPCKGICQ